MLTYFWLAQIFSGVSKKKSSTNSQNCGLAQDLTQRNKNLYFNNLENLE